MTVREYPKKKEQFYAYTIINRHLHRACEKGPMTCMGHEFTVTPEGYKYPKVIECVDHLGTEFRLERASFTFEGF